MKIPIRFESTDPFEKDVSMGRSERERGFWVLNRIG